MQNMQTKPLKGTEITERKIGPPFGTTSEFKRFYEFFERKRPDIFNRYLSLGDINS